MQANTMGITLRKSIIALLLIIVLAFHAQATHKKLIIGVASGDPPFCYMNNGELVGFDVDLINIIGKDLGYNLEIKDFEYKQLLDKLQAKEIDIVVSSISPSIFEEKIFD